MRRVFITLSRICFLIILISSPFLINGSSTSKTRLYKSASSSADLAATEEAAVLYDSLHLNQAGLSMQALQYAIKGFNYLQKTGVLLKTDILSICDFSQSSKNKRLYIIDVETRKLILNTYVAHGRNSGGEYAYSFSNSPESLKSSLGFYITRNTYRGCHGLALRIEGLEEGFNDKADKRNIVVHGSQYVGPNFLRNNPFIGRSFGCPAVPLRQTRLVINTIKNGTCLFIYHPTEKYLKESKILNG
jgi:L,D-transpeptidase catalytic domain